MIYFLLGLGDPSTRPAQLDFARDGTLAAPHPPLRITRYFPRRFPVITMFLSRAESKNNHSSLL